MKTFIEFSQATMITRKSRSRMGKARLALSIFLITTALTSGHAVTAVAEETSTEDIVITSGSEGFSSTLRLSISKPMSATQRQRVVKELT